MAILNVQVQGGIPVATIPNTWLIETDDTEATVSVEGYLNQVNGYFQSFKTNDLANIWTTDRGTVIFIISISNGIISLIPSTFENQNISLPTIQNAIAFFTNIGGHIACSAPGNPVDISNDGDITCKPYFTSLSPSANKGKLSLQALDNTNGNYSTTLQNSADSSRNISATVPDIGAPNTTFLMSTLPSVDSNADIVALDVRVTGKDLNNDGPGYKVLYPSSGNKSYIIRNLFFNSGGKNFNPFDASGVDFIITDNVNIYSKLPYNFMTSPTLINQNIRWGQNVPGTYNALSFPDSVPCDFPTAAGQSLIIKRAFGDLFLTNDGSVVITVIVQRRS